MKIIVTMIGPLPAVPSRPFVGSHLIVSADGVWLDGDRLVERDRRMKVNRVPGHPWIMADRLNDVTWQSFRIEVDPDH